MSATQHFQLTGTQHGTSIVERSCVTLAGPASARPDPTAMVGASAGVYRCLWVFVGRMYDI
jgi:hypothetical protein